MYSKAIYIGAPLYVNIYIYNPYAPIPSAFVVLEWVKRVPKHLLTGYLEHSEFITIGVSRPTLRTLQVLNPPKKDATCFALSNPRPVPKSSLAPSRDSWCFKRSRCCCCCCWWWWWWWWWCDPNTPQELETVLNLVTPAFASNKNRMSQILFLGCGNFGIPIGSMGLVYLPTNLP